MKLKSFSAAFIAAAVLGIEINMVACGPDFPNNLLDDGDHAVLQAPIADFRGELARMQIMAGGLRAVGLPKGQELYEQSAEAEMSALAVALKRAKVTSEQATVILQSHLAERMKLNAYLTAKNQWEHYVPAGYVDTNGVCQLLPNTNPPPAFPEIAITPGLPREFADYFAGAIAWHKDDASSAVEVWQNVLELPEPERHFESTWAAFMIGKYWQGMTGDPNDAALEYFGQVRELAKRGFADPLGLAAASVGEEAKIWLGRKNYQRAIDLYLQQYAAGDESALLSLRFTASAATSGTNLSVANLKALALNPRSRRVITAYLISRHPYNDRSEGATEPNAKLFFDQTDAWLAAVDAAGVKDVELAEQFALAAYQASDMESAQRWIDHSKGSVVAQWLQAKLFLRNGRIDDAARVLAKVSGQLPRELPGTNTPASFAQCLYLERYPECHDPMAAGSQSLGELGVLHLARRESRSSIPLSLAGSVTGLGSLAIDAGRF